MPSRSSSATYMSALLAALGLAIILIGVVQSSKIDQTAGLILATAGAIPLIVLSIRSAQASAGLRTVEEHRAEIEGHAFGLALEMIRTGQLAPLARTTESLTDTGGRRYDL